MAAPPWDVKAGRFEPIEVHVERKEMTPGNVARRLLLGIGGQTLGIGAGLTENCLSGLPTCREC